MPPNNAKQADVLEGAVVLANVNGSAPGQMLDTVVGEYRKIILLLPGPPRELKPLFEQVAKPLLASILTAQDVPDSLHQRAQALDHVYQMQNAAPTEDKTTDKAASGED